MVLIETNAIMWPNKTKSLSKVNTRDIMKSLGVPECSDLVACILYYLFTFISHYECLKAVDTIGNY